MKISITTMALFDSSFTEEDLNEHSNDQDFLLALQLQNQLNQEEKHEKSTKSVEIIEWAERKRVSLIESNMVFYNPFDECCR